MLDQRIWCYLWYFFVAFEDVDVVRLIWYKKKRKEKKELVRRSTESAFNGAEIGIAANEIGRDRAKNASF